MAFATLESALHMCSQVEAYLLEYVAALAPHRASSRIAAEYLAWWDLSLTLHELQRSSCCSMSLQSQTFQAFTE